MLKNKLQKLKPSIRPLPEGVTMRTPQVMLATWFGAGRLRPASGTIGTLAALPFGFAIQYAGGPFALAGAALVLLVFGIRAAEFYGRKTGNPDDQGIVVDEAVGLWIAAIPAETNAALWIAAFFLFRFFDVVKPWPASYFEKKKRGGIDAMMDDVVAGLYALPGVGAFALTYLLQQ